RRHEVRDHGHDSVDDKACKNRRPWADPLGELTKKKRKGNAYELCEQNRGVKVGFCEPNFVSVDDRHLDDGAYAVVVDEKGNEKKGGLTVLPKLAECLAKLRKRAPY